MQEQRTTAALPSLAPKSVAKVSVCLSLSPLLFLPKDERAKFLSYSIPSFLFPSFGQSSKPGNRAGPFLRLPLPVLCSTEHIQIMFNLFHGSMTDGLIGTTLITTFS